MIWIDASPALLVTSDNTPRLNFSYGLDLMHFSLGFLHFVAKKYIDCLTVDRQKTLKSGICDWRTKYDKNAWTKNARLENAGPETDKARGTNA